MLTRDLEKVGIKKKKKKGYNIHTINTSALFHVYDLSLPPSSNLFSFVYIPLNVRQQTKNIEKKNVQISKI